MKTSKVSIVMPVYNEEKTISQILKKVKEVKFPKGIKKEIILINDGSTDKSFAILSKMKDKDLVILNHEINRGKGAALRTGFARASGDVILIQDADLEYNPADLERLIEPIVNGQAKVVYGTRLKNYRLKLWGKGKTVLPTHLMANRLLSLLTSLIYGTYITDMETCYKLISKDVLKKVRLRSNRFEIEPEITAKILKSGYEIVELPIKVKPRTHDEGKKIGWKDGFQAVWTILKYRFYD